MDLGTIEDTFNYQIDNNVVSIISAVAINNSAVLLSIDPLTPVVPGSLHNLTLSVGDNTKDSSGNALAETNIIFEVAAVGTNVYLRNLVYTVLGTGNSGLVNILTNHTKFLNNTPDIIEYVSSFSTPANRADDYGTRVNGYLIPSVSGMYQFRINSDDESRFYLSTDESPDNLRLIVRYPDSLCCNWGWESISVKLEANKAYYFEGLLKEGGGNDSLAVSWRTPLNNNYTTIPGANLAYSVLPSKMIKIIQQPSNITVDENGDATFTVIADSIEKGISYQWQQSVDNGANWLDISALTVLY
jgi:hypothetical protein